MNAQILDIDRVDAAALECGRQILHTVAPGGRLRGPEYLARPIEGGPVSVSINFQTFAWEDRAPGGGASGQGAVSWLAYIRNMTPENAARTIADALPSDIGADLAADDDQPEHVNGAAHDAAVVEDEPDGAIFEAVENSAAQSAAVVEDDQPATAAQQSAFMCVGTLAGMPGDVERFRIICGLLGGQVARREIDRTWATDLLSEGAAVYRITDECGEDAILPMIRKAFEAAAESKEADGPLPLTPLLAASTPYPVDALGPVLGPAAAAIANKIQLPASIAAQSVLAAAALAAQAHADVRMPYGQSRPLSLFFLSVASSGDRKTTADGEALTPIREYERGLRENETREKQDWENRLAAWKAERSKIETDKKLTRDDRVARLDETGAAPARPLHPMLTAPEPTIEGLIKFAVDAPPSLGLFSAEGGQFVGGHGLSPDHKLKTAAALSEMWDGRPVRRVRAGDGLTTLQGRRLSLHMMLQPAAAFEFCGDATLRDQGLLSRMLLAAPDSMAGGRMFRAPTRDDNDAIEVYSDRIRALLDQPWPVKDGTRNELVPRVLGMSAAADDGWQQFHDHIERQLVPNGELRPIADLAAKAAEHAARIAGVLTIVENSAAVDISGECMGRAIALADWYVGEALRLAACSMTAPAVRSASRLLGWLQERKGHPITIRSIVRNAPPEFRNKPAAVQMVGILAGYGWLAPVAAPKADGARADRWELVAA